MVLNLPMMFSLHRFGSQILKIQLLTTQLVVLLILDIGYPLQSTPELELTLQIFVPIKNLLVVSLIIRFPTTSILNRTAHSNGRHGFWVFPQHYPREQPCGPANTTQNPFLITNTISKSQSIVIYNKMKLTL